MGREDVFENMTDTAMRPILIFNGFGAPGPPDPSEERRLQRCPMTEIFHFWGAWRSILERMVRF